MNANGTRLSYLFDRFVDDILTGEERLEFMQLILLPENEQTVKSLIEEQVDNDTTGIKLDELRSQQIFSTILHAKKKPAKIRRITTSKIGWAAAVVAAFVFGIIYFLPTRPPSVSVATANGHSKNDVQAPSTSRAVLKLSDGREIYVDDMADGMLATDGNTDIRKLENGELAYDGKSTGNMAYNTLEVPLGSKPISIGFSDKSKVWLNAGSSIKYPVTFTGNQRVVDIAGEVYFEITKDASKPFIVKADDTKIHVLGTNFNVNAYKDEPSLNVTLLEGSVQVSNTSVKTLLKPGQQAIVTNSIKVSDDIDLNEIMAWKNGLFQFEESSIHAVMRQLARAYNITYEIKGAVSETFGGSISRNANLSQVLKMLELTGVVNFEIKGTNVVVRPG